MPLRQDAVLFSMQTDTLISIADDIWQNCEETHANNLNYTASLCFRLQKQDASSAWYTGLWVPSSQAVERSQLRKHFCVSADEATSY